MSVKLGRATTSKTKFLKLPKTNGKRAKQSYMDREIISQAKRKNKRTQTQNKM